jgi:hypothetical protein
MGTASETNNGETKMKTTRIAALAGALLLLGVGAAAADSGPAGSAAVPQGSAMAQLLGGSPTVSSGSDLQLPAARGTVSNFAGSGQVWQFRCTDAKVGAAPGNIDVAALCGTSVQ